MEEKRLSIIQCMEDKEIFRPLFKDLSTWKSWITFLKSVFGIEMNEDDKTLFKQCTQREEISKNGYNEIYAIVGRRGGKSYISALIAVYEALFNDWNKYLSKGEHGYLFIIATDREQAKIILNYVKGILELFPGAVKKSKTLEVELQNNIRISIKPASFRSGRGYTTIGILMDELAFFRSEESANPADEILTSLLPTLVPNGKVIGISTPYGKFGLLYQTYKEYFGKSDDEILIWKAPTKVMNPTYRDNIIKRMMKRNKSAMISEYMAEFREDISSYLSEELIERAMGEYEYLWYQPSQRYYAFCDPSGGRGDSYTFAIGHEESSKIICDLVEEIRAPFDPGEATKQFAELLATYNIGMVTGDKYAGDWPSSNYKKHNIKYEKCSIVKSDLYYYFQPLVNMKQIMLPKNQRLKNQLMSLERRTQPGGRDTINEPRGLHDDVSNAVAGLAVIIHKKIGGIASKEELDARLPSAKSRLSHSRRQHEDSEKEINEVMFGRDMRPCPTCAGQGKAFGDVCPRCKGKGEVSKYSKITYVQ